MRKLFVLFSLLFSFTVALMAQHPQVIDVWAVQAPHKSSNLQDTAKVYVYLPQKASGRAVIICPGGGYEHMAIGHEGHDWATFFNQQGIAAIVLKYRLPYGDYRLPIEDAEETVRLVRKNATKWHINPNQIGIMGSSAGGHLASTIATHATKDAAPNFQILFYPVITMDPSYTHKGSHDNLLGSSAKKKLEKDYSNDLQVSRATPRAFIALCDDDHTVLPANGVNYYLECYRHDVPASLHVYPSGGHGWGFRSNFAYHIEMLLDLKAWLSSF